MKPLVRQRQWLSRPVLRQQSTGQPLEALLPNHVPPLKKPLARQRQWLVRPVLRQQSSALRQSCFGSPANSPHGCGAAPADGYEKLPSAEGCTPLTAMLASVGTMASLLWQLATSLAGVSRHYGISAWAVLPRLR